MTEVATTYTWPETLRHPARPPKLVYLDLNHWVSLAKAHTGHRDGGPFREALAACVDAVTAGAAVFPISDSIYMEVSKIGQYRQRRDLRDVIERVSGYRVVTSRVVVAQHEIEGLLDRLIGPSPDPINAMDYLDWGVGRAFGMVGGFRIKSTDNDEDVTDEVRSRHAAGREAFDLALVKAELELNRRTLDGPTAEEVPKMRGLGWDPMVAFEVNSRRTTQEMEQVERFNADPSWRHGRIRDVVAAREVAIEINRMLPPQRAYASAVIASSSAARQMLAAFLKPSTAVVQASSVIGVPAWGTSVPSERMSCRRPNPFFALSSVPPSAFRMWP